MTDNQHAIDNAKGWLAEIVELTDALKAGNEIDCGQCEGTGTITGGLGGDGADEECPVCDGTGQIDREETTDDIRQRIDEGPLSVQVRDGWRSPGADSDGPEEYEILLSTGGPALRIVGQLDAHCEPHGLPLLQWQDWGTPWTTYHETTEADDEALRVYSGSFYFGE